MTKAQNAFLEAYSLTMPAMMFGWFLWAFR